MDVAGSKSDSRVEILQKFYNGEWDSLRIILNASGCLLQIAFSFIYELGVGEPTGRSLPASKFQPPGVAFSIWGLIFPLLVLYGIFQCLPSQRENQLLRDVGPWTAFAFYSTCLWALVAQLAAPPASMQAYAWWLFLLLFLPICLPMSHVILTAFSRHQQELHVWSANYWLVLVTLSPYCAWVTAASFVGFSDALAVSSLNEFSTDSGNETTSGTTAFLVLVGLIICGLIYQSRGNVPYTGIYIWAYAWIAENSFDQSYRGLGIGATFFCVAFGITCIATNVLIQLRPSKRYSDDVSLIGAGQANSSSGGVIAIPDKAVRATPSGPQGNNLV